MRLGVCVHDDIVKEVSNGISVKDFDRERLEETEPRFLKIVKQQLLHALDEMACRFSLDKLIG